MYCIMGLCAWRDKSVYFDSSERETRVRMLQKYLDKSKAPAIAGRPSFISECLFNSQVEPADSSNLLGIVYEGYGESTEDQGEDPEAVKRRTHSLPPKQSIRYIQESEESMETYAGPSADWGSLVEPTQHPQRDSSASSASNESAFLFLRSPTRS